MKTKSFRYEEEAGIGTITLDRPERLNALTFDVYEELTRVMRNLQSRDQVDTIVLTGEGKGFCSGGDVNAIIGALFARDMKGLLQFTRLTGELVRNIRELRKPVVAAINGIAAGAGAVIAMACDFRIASDNSKFAFLFTRVGLAGADMGAAYLLPRIVGQARATELLMLGETIPAAQALDYGLVHRVVPSDMVLVEAKRLAEKLSRGPTFAIGMTKELLNHEQDLSLSAAIEWEAQAQAICMQTPEFREAYEAFTENRAADFRKLRSRRARRELED